MNFASSISRPRGLVRTLALLAFGASVAAAQQPQNTLTGRVTDAQNGGPVASALVNVVGTNLGQHTNADGRFSIRGVPAGAQRVRVLRIGYAEQVRAVDVAAGQETTLDI